jgi:hypothetical protein
MLAHPAIGSACVALLGCVWWFVGSLVIFRGVSVGVIGWSSLGFGVSVGGATLVRMRRTRKGAGSMEEARTFFGSAEAESD